MRDRSPFAGELKKAFEALIDDYLNGGITPSGSPSENDREKRIEAEQEVDQAAEQAAIEHFLVTPCRCGRNCQTQFTAGELADGRRFFRLLSRQEKDSSILFQLRAFSHASDMASSGRTKRRRKRQKFEYRISADRPCCREVFLFFHGETHKRLKRLQTHFAEHGTLPPIHGNVGRKPAHACRKTQRDRIETFVVNYAQNHGLPDPGRDLRKGNGRLRILLPSVLNYLSVHRAYEQSMHQVGEEPVAYRTFVRTWQQRLPHIVFNDPRSDLCATCEGYKKELNRIAAMLDEKKEAEQAAMYSQALAHLNLARTERAFYRACTKVAKQHYQELVAQEEQRLAPNKANSRDIAAHYSWDFAQQLHYPYEDQQVGPIYFKTPRRAQVFGVCNEGGPFQVNYLIDEADFLGKNANTVISLLDHYFTHHSLGEKNAYLTADNCVAQNKNNALIQYLMYRVLTGLHTHIQLSFMVVGHTKFSPDGYFGLIRKQYRRSNIYTYQQLAGVVEQSSPGKHNHCQRIDSTVPRDSQVVYRDWVSWLAKYFSKIAGITAYRHFQFDCKHRGVVYMQETANGETTELNLLESNFPYNAKKQPSRLPKKLHPSGLSEERQQYLYKHIREHIPDQIDKDQTCPKPI